ncbi:MAG: type IV pilus assembly protein PilM [Verrucomicrobia bacterium]|nr:type IV pilus assembly protein PilM [Verrucomicrobiota bacterium]
MAAPARILAANLGAQTISIAEFRPQGNGGLVLRAYQRREIVLENPGDAMRQTQITHALREMLDALGVRNARVNYAVPAQSVFARFVKLPAVDEEKIERIIAFEAQQNVPFPIDEVVWDYQLVGGGADEQLQVVLVAIKSDLLEGINAAVEAAGLRPVVIGVATMGLYNAFRYNYSDVTESSLLVDIGARTTNLLFIEQGRIFSRSVPIGGGSVSTALAKEFNESFALAEARKKDAGFVSLGGAYADPNDPEVARMSKLIRGAMTRLHAEIMRSISHYRSQQQGTTPARVYLCGGSSSMPYMREFFQEKLQLPVEFFNPLRNVALAPEANAGEIARSAHLMGELVGLAIRAIATSPIELNLRPVNVMRRHEVERRRPFLVAAAACLILALLGWSVYYLRGAAVLRAGKETVDANVTTLRRFQAQLDAVRKDATGLDHAAAPILSAVNARGYWPQLLEELNARLPPENIWITELIPLSGGKPAAPDVSQLTANPNEPTPVATPLRPIRAAAKNVPAIDGLLIRGLYLWNARQQEVVVEYFNNLARSPFFNIDLKDQQRVIKPTMPNNTEWAFPYELRLDLKKTLPLP